MSAKEITQLKKMGFIKTWTGMWVLDDNDNYIIAEINPLTRELDTCNDEVINKLKDTNFIEGVKKYAKN